MKKYLIWGTGQLAEINYATLLSTSLQEKVNIIGFVDNNKDKCGRIFKEKIVYSPNDIGEIEYDYIDIWVEKYENDIKNQLFNELCIPKDKVRSIYGEVKKEMEKNHKQSNQEIKLFLEKVKDTPGLRVFYYDSVKKTEMYKVYKDEKNNYNYVWFEGKKLYLAKSYSQYIKINEEDYIYDIWAEQDQNSPHLYESGEVVVKEGDILVDAGVCEGNFALHHIDKVKKVYLIECDKEWMEALKLTFAPYKEKVVFCNKFLSNEDSETTITLNSLVKEPIDFLKMDIEGEEVAALLGAEQVLKNSLNLKCSICAYHKK